MQVLASSASILFAQLKMLWIVCAPLFGKVVWHLTLNPKPLCIGLQRLIVFSSYWWMFQILGLLLTSDNGSTAKYIETHELVCESLFTPWILYDFCQVCSVGVLRNLLSVLVTRKFLDRSQVEKNAGSPFFLTGSLCVAESMTFLFLMCIRLHFIG